MKKCVQIHSAVERQDKKQEIAFFSHFPDEQEYNVFSEDSNHRIVDACLQLSGLRVPGKVADLGCGTGVFSALLAEQGFEVTGFDLSSRLIALARRRYPALRFVVSDVEELPIADENLDGILLSGLLHHLPDSTQCVKEVWRVLKPGGVFMAFDPNRSNPFMYLFRDRSSPFYSRNGVTANERPIVARQLAEKFRACGFEVRVNFLSNLQYRYIGSSLLKPFLPIYNWLDAVLFAPAFMKSWRAFVITAGNKPY